jgi:hypothetical protein
VRTRPRRSNPDSPSYYEKQSGWVGMKSSSSNLRARLWRRRRSASRGGCSSHIRTCVYPLSFPHLRQSCRQHPATCGSHGPIAAKALLHLVFRRLIPGEHAHSAGRSPDNLTSLHGHGFAENHACPECEPIRWSRTTHDNRRNVVDLHRLQITCDFCISFSHKHLRRNKEIGRRRKCLSGFIRLDFK